MRLTEFQRNLLVSRWEDYIASQELSGDNKYGSAGGQMEILRRYCDTPARVLFVGCGDGLEVFEARKAGYDAEGVTLGNPDVARAKDVYGIDLVKCDAHLLPDEWEEVFDIVLGFQVLEHSISGMLLLWETRRILKPGGQLYFEWPHQAFVNNSDNWHHLFSPTPSQANAWLLKLGFKQIDTGFCGEDRSDAARWSYCAAVKI